MALEVQGRNKMTKLEKIILDATEYSGNKKKEIRAISASAIGKEPIEIYLRYKHGVNQSENIEQTTLGSLLHLGLEHIFKKHDGFITEHDFSEYELENGWKITGTSDLIDMNTKTIHDYKMIKNFPIKKIKEEGIENSYVQQLNVYRILAENEFNTKFNTSILAFNKEGGINTRTGDLIPSYEEISLPKIEDKIIINMALEKTNIVQEHIDNDTIPEKCEDVWLRKIKQKTVPMKCAFYCSYSNECPHYNPKKETILTSWGF